MANFNEQTKVDVRYGFFQTITSSLRIIIAACGRKELLLFGTGLFSAAVPSVVIYLQKEFFTRAEHYAEGPIRMLLSGLYGILAVWFLVSLSQWLISLASFHAERLISRKVSDYMMDTLLGKISTIRYEYLDTPQVYNKLEWVCGQVLDRVPRVIYGIVAGIYSVITFLSLGVLVFTEDWLIGLIIILGGIPAVLLMKLQNRDEFHHSQWQAQELREQTHVYWLFTRRDSIREMRIGQYSDYLLKKWEQVSRNLRDYRYRLLRKFYFLGLGANILSYVSIGLALWLICRKVLDPATAAGVGSFVLVFSVAMNLQETLTRIFANLIQVVDTGKYMKGYDELEAYEEEPCAEMNVDVPLDVDLLFENVSFSYPNSERLVLQDINIAIRQGEKVAIVGENGSGKSTFVSLLCGLYAPKSGTITFAGKELRENLDLGRRATSVVFQDFGRYELTVAENIGIGNVDLNMVKSHIVSAAKRSGAHEFIKELGQQYDTFLGTLEKGHADFSGGQWQKLAFARAILKRDARVMILDEQTAALDPISEARFYHDFKDLTSDRTCIMISHRLGATKLADRILVFHEGRIAEQGSHEELMSKQGLYYDMYEAQAQWYAV